MKYIFHLTLHGLLEIMNRIVREDIESIIDSSCIDWNVFRDKTILITGANGMLPSYMALTVLRLNQRFDLNIKLICLVRNKAKADIVFSDFIGDKNLEFIVQDVSSPISYEGELHYIIHAASQASPKYYGIDPVGTAKANLLGTINLLELAKEKRVESFLFFSTSGVYGSLPSDDIAIDESMNGKIDQLNINSCYFESKRMAENLCCSYSYQYGVPAKIIRIFHTLGPNMDLNDGRAFSDFCKSVVDGNDIVLKSDGSARRTFCYVTDAIVGFFLVLTKGNSREAYNVGSSVQEVSMKELAQKLSGLYPAKNIKVKFDIDKQSVTYSKMRNRVNRIIPNTEKIVGLGWEENVDYLTAFNRVIISKSLT